MSTRILVVDDSDLIRHLLQEGLTAAGFDVVNASDANTGFRTALETHPDLILLDVQLPDITGFELCRVIRNNAQLQHVPIIMITGTAHSVGEKVKGFQLGADDYVPKPFAMEELVERIRAVLKRKTTENSVPATAASGANQAAAAAVAVVSEAPPEAPSAPVSVIDGWKRIFFWPPQFSKRDILPHVSLPFLGAANGLALAGLAAASGPTLKPLAAVLTVSGLWGLSVCVVVIASSILGIPLRWREGASLFSLAAFPLLLRLLGGVVGSLVTTLSPFIFSTGPALFAKSPAGWMEGFDVCVVWSVLLCGRLLSQRNPQHGRKAWWVAFGLWIFFIIVGFGTRKFA
jgi:CheY-like chemotaxis protein